MADLLADLYAPLRVTGRGGARPVDPCRGERRPAVVGGPPRRRRGCCGRRRRVDRVPPPALGGEPAGDRRAPGPGARARVGGGASTAPRWCSPARWARASRRSPRPWSRRASATSPTRWSRSTPTPGSCTRTRSTCPSDPRSPTWRPASPRPRGRSSATSTSSRADAIRPDAVAGPSRPRVVVLPRYERGAGVALEPLGPPTRSRRVAEHAFHLDRDGPRRARDGRGHGGASSCWSLVSGDVRGRGATRSLEVVRDERGSRRRLRPA